MRNRALELPSERIARIALWVFSSLVLLFLVAPILVTIPLSFNAGSYFSYPITSYSWRWYDDVFTSSAWRQALTNSLFIGLMSTLLATSLGTLAAMGLSQPAFPWRGLIMPLLISPMIVPIIVVAVGLYLVFAPLGLTSSYLGIILAHTALGAPFVLITVTATLMSFDRTLLRAAGSLGANPWKTFWRVVLPLILPGVVTGAIFAFATSLDEVIVVLFIGGVEQRTIPRQMWTGIRDHISPSILSVAALLTVFAVALYLAIDWLRGRTPTIRGSNGS